MIRGTGDERRAPDATSSEAASSDAASVGTWTCSLILRLVIFGALWVLLSGADAYYLGYGAVSVAAAAGLSLALTPPRYAARPRTWGRRSAAGIRLAGWFLIKSVHGGVDVAVRAVRPRLDVAPEVVTAPLELPRGGGRQLALLMMNLMPGTMVQRVLDDEHGDQHGDQHHNRQGRDRVELHTLSRSLEPAEQWRRLQELVAPVFDRGRPRR
ncbi:Na+/H+ antiporter subunit E [Nesterenkonia marinintestina]|uniref:Na+/H+ antiporter subunit E n=1 Tax=Nesterenkonia marinintestina TaxID=2979865 RepID=UPI0021BED1B0|nr:Na+/H+ antiporter subunit E [Nesterenkonia sp. GX14115]